MTGIEMWMMIGICIPIVLLISLTPLLTRKVEAFGVTVPDGVKQEAYISGHIKRYMLLSLATGLIMLVGLFCLLRGSANEVVIGIGYSIILMAYIALSFFYYLNSHFKIKAWKKEQSWYLDQQLNKKIVVQTSFHQAKTTISVLWYLPHFLIVIFTIAYSILNFDKFPDLIPMKYDFDGNVIRAVEKSFESVLSLSFIGLAMLVVFIFTHYSIAKSKQVIENKDPAGSLQRNIIFRYAWSIYTASMAFLLVIMMSVGQLLPLLGWTNGAYMAIVFGSIAIILVGAIVLSFVIGQGGSRLKMKAKADLNLKTEADLDQYWKAGAIYWNPNDPALFVEKRFGVGWTMNFARPMSWILMIGIIVIALVPILFVK